MGSSSLRMPTGYLSPVRLITIYLLWLAACLGTVNAFAEPHPEPFPLTRIDFEVVLDGKLEESGWQQLTPLPFTQLQPVAGVEPTEETRVVVAYDDQYLYAAADMLDSDAAGVRGNSLQRDSDGGDDMFTLLLDSFNDNENGLIFSTNPVGTRIDETVANDAESGGGSTFNRSWNTYWDAAASRHDRGWSAEMRIPLTSLRFQNEDGQVVMGMTVTRWISRKNEAATFPALDPSLNRAQFKPSAARDVALHNVETRSPIYTTAYVLAGRREELDVNDDETAFSVSDEDVSEVGLDVKYALTSNLNLDLTVNTDFAQVEADDAQVNLSRFSLFQTEKRQFFQERSSIFNFHTGGPSRLFYSRRVGLSEDGEAVPILGGIRLVGRMGDWDVGFMDMQTRDFQGEERLESGENFGILRLRRKVLNERSYIGGIAASRVSSDGYNYAWGLDTVLRLTDLDELTVRLAQTFDEDPETGERSSDSDSFRLYSSLARRTADGLGYDFTFAYSGEDYQPDLGFAARSGFFRLSPNIDHSSIGTRGEDRFQRINYWFRSEAFWDDSDRELESAYVVLGGNRQTWAGGWFWFDLNLTREQLEESFEIGEVEVVAGRHDFYSLSGGFRLAEGQDFTFWGNLHAGTFYDGERYSFQVNPGWVFSKFLSLATTYQWNGIRFPDREQELDIHLARVRLRFALNNRLSVDLFTQYSSLAGSVASNLRFRYNFSEGTDLYVVYNESQNTDRLLDTGLELPERIGRSLLVKYSYTLPI